MEVGRKVGSYGRETLFPEPGHNLILPIYIFTYPIGLRPFGVSFLFAGWDRHHGFQLYESDPAGRCNAFLRQNLGRYISKPDIFFSGLFLLLIGTFGGWTATAIGANFQVSQ